MPTRGSVNDVALYEAIRGLCRNGATRPEICDALRVGRADASVKFVIKSMERRGCLRKTGAFRRAPGVRGLGAPVYITTPEGEAAVFRALAMTQKKSVVRIHRRGSGVIAGKPYRTGYNWAALVGLW